MANIKSEQITKDLTLRLDYDNSFTQKELIEIVVEALGKDNCYIENFKKKKLLVYNGKKKEILLLSSITYMGGYGMHPVNLKRSQLKKWYKEIVLHYQNKSEYNVRFIGVYKYDGNIVFADYIKDTFIKKQMNNSAVHVRTNYLYQALLNGIYEKIDRLKNKIITTNKSSFKGYLDGSIVYKNNLFELFKKFSKEMNFNKWNLATEILPILYQNGVKYKQGEWPAFYLEYKFDDFCKKNNILNDMCFVGNDNKKNGELDFDIFFKNENFYGDLKASSSDKKEAPGNDWTNFKKCISDHKKFWYVIYEHETILDKNSNTDYSATRFRANFILQNNDWPKNKKFDELSYFGRMKHSVRFNKMYIIELNEINYKQILKDFPQGHQKNGDKRNIKSAIKKGSIDNYIVYEYTEN